MFGDRSAIIVELPDSRRRHQCSVCHVESVWDQEWTWYGSWKDLDDGKKIVKTCSKKCRSLAKTIRLIPMNAINKVEDD